MNNYLNQSYKYHNNNANIKLVPKTKSLNNFHSNTLKILRTANQLNNSNSKPIKIKTNTQPIIENKDTLHKPKTPNQDGNFNKMIQEYNYFKYIYNPKNNNLEKQKFKYKLNIKRPSTAPQKNKNKKEVVNKQNKNLNNFNFISNNIENEQIYNFYHANNNRIRTNLIGKPKRNISNMNMYNKLFKPSVNRPPSPMIEPHMRLNNY